MGGKESKFNWKLPMPWIIGAVIGFAFSILFVISSTIEDSSSIRLTILGVDCTLSAICIGLTIGVAALGLTLIYLTNYEVNKKKQF